ncbi:hypothetical protein ACFVT5_14690 [Streptomyces sp. NPDC058001]|uniref:hypothetical protein n=1 Tax=Streptomyces sp. NPDC058001 TaxID=3346300 RepID=UPI0036F0BB9C
MRRRRMLAVGATVGALSLTGLVSATASAAPMSAGSGVTQPQSDVSTQGTAPDCVTFKVHTIPGFVRVTNGCNTSLRLRPIISFGPDGTCQQVPAGSHHDWWLPILRIDRIESC